jgi:lysophospholipase L1-like esterase
MGAAAVVAIVVAVAGTAMIIGPLAGGGSASSRSASQSASSVAFSSDAPSLVPSEGVSGDRSLALTQTATPTLGPTPSPTAPATPSLTLPSLLGAIGDSYSQGYSVSPQHRYDNPTFSWVVGSATGHGVYSLRERLQALGADLTVVDAATSGKKMSDAPRQAASVVASARKLEAGRTAYVTFELGTNDLCDDAKTSPSDFEAQLVSAVSILRNGLPLGSEILMLPIPDFEHFRSITQADPQARTSLAQYVNSRNCAPFLGSSGLLTLDQARAAMVEYNSILLKVCDGIQSTDGASGRLYCRTEQALLSERDFTIEDLSTVDYFHPSLSGQAKMAAAAWSASAWGAMALPAGG